MQIEALRAFHETARLLSIRKAGEKLGVAPSSVSRHIKTLEQLFGASLIERSALGVTVTHAGERVAAFARAVLSDYSSLRMDLDERRGGHKATIRVALVEGMSAAGPSLAITRFRQRFPDVRFDCAMMSAPRVDEAVRRADADLGIGFGANFDPEFSAMAVTAEPLVFCIRRERAPRGGVPGDSVDVRSLSAEPLGLPGKDFAIRTLLDQAALEAGAPPFEPVLSSNSFEILRDFAVSGGGGVVLPARALRGKTTAGLHVVTIRDPHLRPTYVRIIALKPRRLPRVVDLFRDELGKALTEA
jgi:DNA-binding transcriptional LysR family regulator